jgi:hypothetical protein
MTKLVTVIYIGAAMIINVFPSPFDTIVKTLALDIAKLLRRLIPSTGSRTLCITLGRTLRRTIVLRY